uniref:ATP-dependent DNA helicase n=1 Tax=Trichogramma kaykai TaxID=54128 RepID=A0ABD2WH54_9HYME
MVKVITDDVHEGDSSIDEKSNDHDEINQYINARYLCPPEAMYRINKYKLHDISHAIVRLAVHKENEQNVYFNDREENVVLTKNRLTVKDDNFKKWLLHVGEGKRSNEYESENESIYIPDDLICEFEEIITEIYGRQIRTEDESTHDKVILAPTKVEVIELNNKILSKGEGDTREYLSIDAVSDEDKLYKKCCIQRNIIKYDKYNYNNSMPVEFLNTLTPNGLPPQNLILKVGVIDILL